MKNPWEWDEADLFENIQNSWKESIDLDFKASNSLQNTDGKKKEISKDVSAFANSAGGTIVYGVLEDGFVATGLDRGSDPSEITKEWLENVINSSIQRRINGIRIHQVDLVTTSQGRVAYLVTIPQSTQAPHQALDKRFYKRFNFQSVPMEEYEVRDIAHRAETPDLRMYFKLDLPPHFEQGTPASDPFSLDAIITNDTLEPANYAVIKIYLDERIQILSSPGLSITQNVSIPIRLEDGMKTHPVNLLSLNWNIPNKLPIFHAQFRITDKPLHLKTPEYVPLTQENYLLGYEILSPHMSIKKAFTYLTVISDSIRLSAQYFNSQEFAEIYRTIQWERNRIGSHNA
jgi:hypothetical protein